MKVQINELVGLEAIERNRLRPHCTVHRPLRSEIEGETLEPGDDGIWRIPLGDNHDMSQVSVEAIELDHTVPTVGWVLREAPRPGHLDAAAIIPLLKAQGVPFENLKKVKQGIPLELPDGSVLQPSDFLGPPTQRKIAILSDMRRLMDPTIAETALYGADLMVHEATNACTTPDHERGVSPKVIENSARKHGHSTPQMAGKLAKKVSVRQLILTHFSPKYAGDASPGGQHIMDEIRLLAEGEFRRGCVHTAVDLMSIRVHIDGSVKLNYPETRNSPSPSFVPAQNTSRTPIPGRESKEKGKAQRSKVEKTVRTEQTE